MLKINPTITQLYLGSDINRVSVIGDIGFIALLEALDGNMITSLEILNLRGGNVGYDGATSLQK